jgi:S-formylglutathione hydrolase
MYSYVADELPTLLDRHFPLNGKRGVSGHSMGGHGALTIALRNPDRFRAVSAMAPIVSPTRTDWGRKALTAYLGADQAPWAQHDATLLLQSGAARGRFDDMLVDQGLADQFLAALQPHLLEEAAALAGQRVTVRRQEGYDHSYWFVQSFIADHLDFHAARLK